MFDHPRGAGECVDDSSSAMLLLRNPPHEQAFGLIGGPPVVV